MDYSLENHPHFKVVSWTIQEDSDDHILVKDKVTHGELGKGIQSYFAKKVRKDIFEKLEMVDSLFVSGCKYFMIKYKLVK